MRSPVQELTHPFGFDSPAYYYKKGILTGFAVAIELAEECSTVEELLEILRKKVKQ